MINVGVNHARWRKAWTMVLFLLAAAAVGRTQQVADDTTVIEDVTLISPERPAPLRHTTVVIRQGKVAAIGTGLIAGPQARRIDGRGRFLIPGLIDSHVHVGAS